MSRCEWGEVGKVVWPHQAPSHTDSQRSLHCRQGPFQINQGCVFADPDPAVFLCLDPDPAAFSVGIHMQLKKLSKNYLMKSLLYRFLQSLWRVCCTILSNLYSLFSNLHSPLSTYSPISTPYSPLSTLHSMLCNPVSPQSTILSLLPTPHSSLPTIHPTLHSLQLCQLFLLSQFCDYINKFFRIQELNKLALTVIVVVGYWKYYYLYIMNQPNIFIYTP